MKKKIYVMAAAMALTTWGVTVEASTVYSLPGVVVQGDSFVYEEATLPGGFINEKATVGLLGNADIMRVPFSVSNINANAMATYASPASGVTDTLAFNPSVRTSAGGTNNNVSIRGISQTGRSMYVNGIPNIAIQGHMPYNFVESVSVTSGPGMGTNGSTLEEAAGGVVNFQSKRAQPEGNRSVSLSYRGGHSMEGAIDFGRRYGNNNRYGVRVNSNYINGETTINNEKLGQKTIFVNVDQNTINSKSNLLLGYARTKIMGGRRFMSFDNSLSALPKTPDHIQMYRPAWFYNEYSDFIVGFNHEQKINNHVTAFTNLGYHYEDWPGYLDGAPRITNINGDFNLKASDFPMNFNSKYFAIGIKGEFNINKVNNEYLISYDWNKYHRDAGNINGVWQGQGNIYGNNVWNPLPNYIKPSLKSDYSEKVTGWNIIDTIKLLDDKLLLTLGIHGHSVDYTKKGILEKSKSSSPIYGITYKLSPSVTIYGNHAENFLRGTMVPAGQGYANEREMLDPSKTKQNEVGIKIKTGNSLNTIALFDIKKANTIDVFVTQGADTFKYMKLEGHQSYKGAEWQFTGNIKNKWDIIGGVMWLKAKQKNTSNSVNDGRNVNGVPKLSANLGAVYHSNENLSFIGRITYLASSTINNEKLRVPGFLRYDLGASYKLKMKNETVTITAMCYNLTNKKYWIPAAGSNILDLSSPRTFVLSANYQF